MPEWKKYDTKRANAALAEAAKKHKPKQGAPAPKTGVIYARYSSHAQKEESIEQQVKECLEYAEARNIQITHIYADEHITGKTERRPQYQQMMKDAEKGEFQTLVAYKSNRISRKMLHALIAEAKLEDSGIKTLYAKEEFGDHAAGRFAQRMMMNVNQFYSENMAEDIKRGLMDNARECKVNNEVAYGYRRGEDGKYAIDEEKAPVVREIFERVLRGDTFMDIARDLNMRCIPAKRGKEWNKGSFHAMLKNDVYIGTYRYAGIVVEGGVPPIIEEEVFYAMQNHLVTKKNPKGRKRNICDYLLTGKLRCGHCKSFMVGISGTSKMKVLHYYYTCNKRRTEGACDKKAVKKEWLETLIAEMTKDFIARDDVIQWIADSAMRFQKEACKDSEIQALEDTLAENKKAIKNIMTAIENGIFTESTKDRLLERENENKEIERTLRIAREINQPQEREQIVDALGSLRDGDVADVEYQKHLLNFVKAVFLWDDKIEIHYYYGGDGNSMTFSFDPEPPVAEELPEGSYELKVVDLGGIEPPSESA